MTDPLVSSATLASESAAPRAEVENSVADEVDEGDVSGHVTTDSSSSDSDGGDRELVQRQFFPPTAPNGYTFLQHQKSKLLHYMRIEDQRVLACGRMRSQAYSAPSVLRYDSAVCHACQRAAQRD